MFEAGVPTISGICVLPKPSLVQARVRFLNYLPRQDGLGERQAASLAARKDPENRSPRNRPFRASIARTLEAAAINTIAARSSDVEESGARRLTLVGP